MVSVAKLDLEHHRPRLLRFARLHLRDSAAAEDAVQEALLAAVQGAAGYSGASSIRTWLIGILRHKIIDHVRRQSREPRFELRADETGTADFDALFSADGHYAEAPADWGDPETSLDQAKFFEALERCLDSLPNNTARVFMMRELLGMGTDEICKELGISATNCAVLLYRARMALRACLESGWFARI